MDFQDELDRISGRIRKLRKERGYTVQELAYRCDIERSNLSRIEAGKCNVTLKTLCSICNALEVGLDDLVGSGGRDGREIRGCVGEERCEGTGTEGSFVDEIVFEIESDVR